jgi:hypothetical protein
VDDGVELEPVDGAQQRFAVDDVGRELGRTEGCLAGGVAGDARYRVPGTHQEWQKVTPYFSGRTGK